ncbi:hypothetical protein [Secundilactobacillus kimchicus]|uniref:hypothetical protein n=1 Tax=Secundilactobacillus kimchicus TaxID=528209 RepID=UPI0006CF81EC|nr:hypothetical protein [Secundilactobacillus kimchicus]
MPLIIGAMIIALVASLLGNILNPIAWLLTPLLLWFFSLTGVSSIILAIAQVFGTAVLWLPFTFGIVPFAWYLAFVNPIWYVIISGAWFPVIGWIPLLFGFGYWLVGMWGAGALTALSFAIFIIGAMFLLNNVVWGLATLSISWFIPSLIGTAIFLGLLALPIILISLLLFLPEIIFGITGLITLSWLFAPILTQLAVNPIADLVAFIIMRTPPLLMHHSSWHLVSSLFH